MGVAGSGLDLEDTLLNGEKGNIKGTTTQVKDEHVALTLDLLVETVSDSGGGGLVDDAEDVKTGDQTGIFRGLALRVVEVGWDGDDSVVDGATEVGLGSFPHLCQDHRGDLLGCEVLALALEFDLDNRLAALVDDLEGEVLHVGLHLSIGELAANESLGVEDGVDGVHRDLVLRGIADQTLGVGECDERGGCAVALVVGDDLNSVIAVDTGARVGRAQIDTDCGCHDVWCVCEGG